MRRLKSGELLLVKHGPLDKNVKREQLRAFVSDDCRVTWKASLLLDQREDVTYPDAAQPADGTIYLVYGRQRRPLGEVLMAIFTETDIRAGKAITDKVRLREVICHLQPNLP